VDEFASGLSDPVGITYAGPGDDRLFVNERAGRIKIVQANGTVLPTPFLDISGRVDSSHTEEGLLGLVFHPDYVNNDYFYVNYTNTSSGIRRTRISRFEVNANVADPNSEEILLTVTQPAGNHNAGDMHFGPDGFLYIPLGDGGGGGDPDNYAQNPNTLLGKVVRINVDSGSGSQADCSGQGTGNYTVPLDNPYRDGSGGHCDEIWALGLRNPWRSSFDRLTGDFYLGDVGQNSYEEVNFQTAGSAGGENYGWRCYEGNHSFNLNGCGPSGDYVFPILEYDNPAEGCSVVGGYVYRGSSYPFMVGHYLLTDYCSGNFWDLAMDESGWQITKHTNLQAFGYASFGEDADGELYLVNRSNGRIYKLKENTVGPILAIDKSGPLKADSGQPVSYTLTIRNNGNLTATNMIVTDTIPSEATYIPNSGGTKNGQVIYWNINNLPGYGQEVQVTFAVTAAQTILNDDYGVSAAGGVSASGDMPVMTIIVRDEQFIPLIHRE
jgi:uncharacterized repeat protein (TIGR01451 family)